jgi:hypothetical protein
VPLQNKKSPHQTRQQNIFIKQIFILIHLNCTLGAALQQEVAASDRAPDIFILNYFCCLNCASGAAPQQGVEAADRAPAFLLFVYFIHCNLGKICIRYRSTRESRHQTGHQIYKYFYLFRFIWFEHQVLLHNKESLHHSKHKTFLLIYINSF